MSSIEAKDRFAELLGCARVALWEVGATRAGADSGAVLRAVTATSRAAGFIEGVTICDPFAARDMVTEFETLVLLAEKAECGGGAERGGGRLIP